MATLLKQSTAVDIGLGPFVDDTDGKTAETALSIAQADVRLKKNNGNWAQKSDTNSATHEENGWYEVALNTTDTGTLGILIVNVSKTGALPVWREFMVVPANVYDSLVAGSDVLQADVTQFNGTNGTFASGRPEVNTSHVAGSSVSTSSAQIGVNVVNAGGTAWGSGAITAASIASGALTSAKFAAGALDAVWSVTTRLLTAGTNIVLAKGTGVTGFNDLDASGVRGAVGLASANLDTQIGTLATASALSTVAGYVDTEVAAIKAVTDALPDAGALTSLATASALATVDSNVDAIKAKTDSLTFTTAGQVDANVQYVNDVEVAGDGDGTPWGPAA